MLLDTSPAAQRERAKRPRNGAQLQAARLQLAAAQIALLLASDAVHATDADARARYAAAYDRAVSAWERAQDRLRILQGKPLPGSLRPESAPKSSRKTRVSLLHAAPDPKPTPTPSPEP